MAATTVQPGEAAALPAHVEKILTDFVEAAKKSFAERLSSIVLFGTAAEGRMRATSDVNMVLVLHEYLRRDVEDLAPTLRLARAGIQLQPIFLLTPEVPAAVECFAQKFGDIIRRHRILYGTNPFEGKQANRAAEIFRLRQVLLNLALRMRAAFAESAGQDEKIALLLADVAGPLRTSAAAFYRVNEVGIYAPKEAMELFVDQMGRAEYKNALREISEMREQRASSSGDLAGAYFVVFEILDALRAKVWGLQ